MYELTMNDLRRLGKKGNATVLLVNGKRGELRADGLYYTRHNAIIGGVYTDAKFRMDFQRAISKIKNIRVADKLVAKRYSQKLVATSLYEFSKVPDKAGKGVQHENHND
ncbi:hypothetical protein [Fructobacillus tropaeoli]|uniref:Uncharacterized protein n=1 Tax=Fructobacillus tropaeoli TaxID=709323 RepID=A0ABN9YYY4_9LACO|nr:hypothetical protein [Fructobacillus tropaeoli]GIC69805.1 hypothetical protein FT12353_04430 [Fructobacillus tropaeoli]CAK1253489.1 hypothetical protein R55227_BLOPHJLP_01537 [Fructobacillus tropaeoli]CAK1253815.1 hypothetical protein R53137_KAKDMLNK_01514 [Fructobacillus tropaeoli]